ncbi:MAG TPA: hypothetical protein VFL29_02745 [Candidatus Dormibacteraeota bacterium]|nr:hypothetical protein [Candidatus Dormibacteraeota bacterium]
MSKFRWPLACLGLALALVSCSTQPPTGRASPTSTAPASCRLPVVAAAKGQGSGPLQAGFITLPTSAFAPDPGAAGGSFYDRALQRWVAVAPPVLSADGLSYAYFDGGTKQGNVELADLRSGTFRLLTSGGPWQVVGIGTGAVYLMQMEFVNSAAYGLVGIGRGLWQVPLSGGTPIRLTTDSLNWTWVDSRAVYAAGVTSDVAGGPNPVVRFDLGTGQVATWFDRGARTRLLAVDASGAGLAIMEGADEELWRIPVSGEPVKVWSGATDAIRPWGPVAVDGTDVWFSSSASTPQWAIYHYSPQLGLRQVALFSDHPVTVAGPCT